jgi:hypothetical protein
MPFIIVTKSIKFQEIKPTRELEVWLSSTVLIMGLILSTVREGWEEKEKER